jgi:hypothetical protein
VVAALGGCSGAQSMSTPAFAIASVAVFQPSNISLNSLVPGCGNGRSGPYSKSMYLIRGTTFRGRQLLPVPVVVERRGAESTAAAR